MLRLEPRGEPSRLMSLASPLLALAITIVAGFALFTILGKDPVRGLEMFFVEPVKSLYGSPSCWCKATPLLLIALGLAVCFRSNVWNIGAEGQFIVGRHRGERRGDAGRPDHGPAGSSWPSSPAGVVGGMVWAAIVAFLRDRFNANEILVSLMLVYVAELLLGYLVYGPWKDPQGYNFPQTITFLEVTQIPRLFEGLAHDIGPLIALFAVGAFWVFLFRTYAGFQLQVGGPRAARRPLRGLLVAARSVDALLLTRAGWPASPARSKRAARSASSRRTCPRATASRPSSWRSSAGCTRSASCSRRCS